MYTQDHKTLEKQQFSQRISKSVKKALIQGWKTTIWLLKLTIPISFAVLLLKFFGILDVVALAVAPLFQQVGLPGVAAVVLITGIFTNIYSVVAVITTLSLPVREGTILAVMCLVAHNMVVETAIQKKTGSSLWRILMVRLGGAFLIAWMLNMILPGDFKDVPLNMASAAVPFRTVFLGWGAEIIKTTIKIVVLVNLLMILQEILNEFNLIVYLVKPFSPLMKLFGLPESTTFLWIVANTLGLAYGGAIMIGQANEGKLDKKEADLLNHHVAVSHSQLEDPLLFLTLGYSYAVMVIPRMFLAMFFVWGRRLELKLISRFKKQNS